MARNEIRKSQGVVPFGVGATVDFESESLMSAGLDVWPSEKAEGAALLKILEGTQIADGRLARRLSSELKRKIEFFLSPTEAPEPTGFQTQQQLGRAFMPFVRFPNWYFCPRCRILKRIAWNTQSSPNSAELKCSNLGRRQAKSDPSASPRRIPPRAKFRNRIFAARDEEAKSDFLARQRPVAASHASQEARKCGLFSQSLRECEITRMRGGPGRTRTCNQTVMSGRL
jgi:hypothetical protein